MTALFNHRYDPITFGFGFVRAPLDAVTAAFLTWKKSIGLTAVAEDSDQPLEDSLAFLQPLTLPDTRYLWVKTRSEWTAYFHNSLLDFNPSAPISHLCGILGSYGLALSCILPVPQDSESSKALNCAVSFDYFGPSQTDWLNLIRSVSVVADQGEWEFSAVGTPQPFEQVDCYNQPLIQSRFTSEMLNRYCTALGLDIFNDSFYLPRSLVISEQTSRILQSKSLPQARHDAGLR